MFGKIDVNGKLIYAPNIIKYNGYIHHNPKDEIYLANGYLPIVETPYPEIDEENFKYYIERFEQQETEIVQTWIVAEDLTNE